MEIGIKKRATIYSGTSNLPLAQEITDHLGMALGDVTISRFASGEIYVRFQESARGTDAFVIQTHCAPVNEMIMEQLLMIDALKRASAKRINAVIPFYGYARQDRKSLAREPISARLVADLLQVAGADRVLSVDLHSGQIQGFFDIPVDHLTALPILAEYVEEHHRDNIAVVAPDAGGTLMAAVNHLIRQGASEGLAAASHAVLSGDAIPRIAESALSEVIVTNSMPLPSPLPDKIKVVSIAPIVASTIEAGFQDESVSEIFQGENQDAIPPQIPNRRPKTNKKPHHPPPTHI